MTSPIEDTTIEALAKDICSDSTVDEFGLKLGYNFEALDFYKANNHTGNKVTYQGTKQMLIDWRRKTPQEQQRSKLRKALDDAGLVRLAEIHLDDTTREAVAAAEQTLKRETETRRGQQTQQQPGVTNTISASDSSNVSGNTMIGQQTNVYNKSTPSAPVVHHHYTTNVKQAAPPRPVFIQQQGQKRQATTSPAPPTKRSKVTQARPSTSKATTSKRKKSKPKSTTQSKKATSKKKSQTAPNAPKKRTPKTASTKKNSQRKKQTVKKKKPPKTTKPKSQQRARSKTKPTKSKRK